MRTKPLPEANGASHEALERVKQGIGVPPLPSTRPALRLHFLSYPEMLLYPEPRWLIPGLLMERSSALLFGKSNAFKSFLAIDIACSVATGHTWHGCPVSSPGPVLYIATEGAAGVARQRIPGWMEARAIPEETRHNISLFDKEIGLDSDHDVEAILEACAQMRAARQGSAEPVSPRGAFRLIVIDIFGASMNGAETDHETARAWVGNINRIIREVGCTVLTVAHTGWSDDKRAGGHSHFWGSFDTRLQAEGNKEARTAILRVERHKDGDSTGCWAFKMNEVPVPGAEGTSTLIPLMDMDVLAAQRRRVSGKPALLLKVLSGVMDKEGEVRVGTHYPEGRSVTLEQWRQACPKAELTDSDKPDALKKAFNRARNGLVAKGLVKQVENLVWILDGEG